MLPLYITRAARNLLLPEKNAELIAKLLLFYITFDIFSSTAAENLITSSYSQLADDLEDALRLSDHQKMFILSLWKLDCGFDISAAVQSIIKPVLFRSISIDTVLLPNASNDNENNSDPNVSRAKEALTISLLLTSVSRCIHYGHFEAAFKVLDCDAFFLAAELSTVSLFRLLVDTCLRYYEEDWRVISFF
jgi:hypothetical protein